MTPFDQQLTSKSVHLLIPNLTFPNENTLRVNNSELEINSKSRQFRILQYFGNNPTGILKKEDLLDILHERQLEKRLASVHFKDCIWKNCHQVLSRLRRTMAYCFAKHMPAGTEWLPYVSELDGWILYKLPGYGSDGGWHA